MKAGSVSGKKDIIYKGTWGECTEARQGGKTGWREIRQR